MQAYELQYFQISGLSSRRSKLFNITARVSVGASREQFRLMLRHLLADRFKLVVHREFKDMPMYDLVVAKNGPKLEESAKDAVPRKNESQPTSRVSDAAVDKDGFPLLPPDRRGMVVIQGHVRMRGVQESMEEFAAWLSNQLDLPHRLNWTQRQIRFQFALDDSRAGPDSAAAHGRARARRLCGRRGLGA
jgi:uncharacterized protein (TIGR03435 family)